MAAVSGKGQRQAGQIASKFTTGSPLRHVVVMTFTGSVGLMAVFAVDLANLFYISMLGVKELAAAVGFAGSILFFQISLCIGLTIGTGAIVARAIGAGEREEARRLAGSSLIVMAVLSLVIGVATVPFLDTILSALGAQGETKRFAELYLTIVSPTMPLLGIGMCCSALLRAVGDARRSMNVTLFAGLATAVLDPILIFGFDLDLMGAAIAALLSRCVLVAIGWRGASGIHDLVGRPSLKALGADARALFKVAGPATLTNIATPVASAYVTYSMAKFGDAAVAGLAIVDRIVPVAFGVIFALSGAVGPIFAQNLGARRYDRIRETLRASLIVMLVYVATLWLVLFLGQDLVVRVFSVQGIAAEIVRLFCTMTAGGFLFIGCLFVGNAAFNNLGFPLLSTGFNWGRATLGTIPFVTLGASVAGAQGIIYGQAAGSLIFGLAAVVMAFRVVGRLRDDRPEVLASDEDWRAPAALPASSGKAALATLAVRPAEAED
ncbi:multidrug transporter MatE [Skermanella stibiiresistens SB22]|uniref:Multidrug transporter MatE n=1 Tax=Skermanella stibiiresistens SB22 TaxID=1385369 RepID=W9HEB1_9PROT|nr:MATE family efflux transporter [Skermanella stibiiresistens]EWY42218.1 multidrug transporter MatE [Skermanella stibiiresistens SB22]